MFQNYLFAALRNLIRNRAYSAIGVLSLGIGLAAALICGLMVRQETTYEHFIPGYERAYLVASSLKPVDRQIMYLPETPGFVASKLKTIFPEVESVARLALGVVRLRHGELQVRKQAYWADPAFSEVLPLPVRHGSLAVAMHSPDGIALPVNLAKQLFGQDDPIGQSVDVNDHPFTVRAVVEDLPQDGTNLQTDIFIGGLADFSGVSQCDRADRENLTAGTIGLCGLTFFRLRQGADIESISRGAQALIDAVPSFGPGLDGGYPVFPIDKVNRFEGFHPGVQGRLAQTVAIGLLILLVGCVVYINLATARASRRAKEVGVRKACGATRWHLVSQFLGESMIFAAFATVLATSLVELALPLVNKALNQHIEFGYWREPSILIQVVWTGAAVGLAAGFYPALVLSAFKPKDVLKGLMSLPAAGLIREALVSLQFAILIGLIVAAMVIYRQRDFAMHDAMRLQTDQILLLKNAECVDPLLTELRKLPGVRAAYCSDPALFTMESFDRVDLKDGTLITLSLCATDFAVFEEYGLNFLAGSIEPRDSDGSGAEKATRIIINESAVRQFGFASPAAAVGHLLPLSGETFERAVVVAVVPDFALEVVKPVRPTLFVPKGHHNAAVAVHDFPDDYIDVGKVIHLKLNGQTLPETLAALDSIWKSVMGVGNPDLPPLRRQFVHEYVEHLYQSVLSQAKIFAGFAVIAVSLACLGLLGLAAAAAERRQREFGVRKALGAGHWDILGLLLKKFAMPVVWGSLLAWPIVALLLQRWLEGFAQHISLRVDLFLLATLLAFAANALTVIGFSWRIASTSPTAALHSQ